MPTKEEYASRFDGVTDPIMSGRYKNRADIRRLAASARKAVREERNTCTREISGRWKEKFAEVKKENDEWQKALDQAFREELQMIDDRIGDMEEALD